MIEIQGLNQIQQHLCDQLWECDTVREIERFINRLPTSELRAQARAMQEMILAAVLDDLVQTLTDCEDAVRVLAKNQLR